MTGVHVQVSEDSMLQNRLRGCNLGRVGPDYYTVPFPLTLAVIADRCSIFTLPPTQSSLPAIPLPLHVVPIASAPSAEMSDLDIRKYPTLQAFPGFSFKASPRPHD